MFILWWFIRECVNSFILISWYVFMCLRVCPLQLARIRCDVGVQAQAFTPSAATQTPSTPKRNQGCDPVVEMEGESVEATEKLVSLKQV